MTKKNKKASEPEIDKDTVPLYVLYSTRTQEDNRGDRDGYGRESHHTTTFHGAAIGKKPDYAYNLGYAEFDIPKEAALAVPRTHVFAVVGYYSNSDTFSRSSGHMHIVDVYGNAEKAYAVVRALTEEDKNNESIFGSGRSLPWGGWGSCLERLVVEILPVTQVDFGPKAENKNHKDIPSW